MLQTSYVLTDASYIAATSRLLLHIASQCRATFGPTNVRLEGICASFIMLSETTVSNYKIYNVTPVTILEIIA